MQWGLARGLCVIGACGVSCDGVFGARLRIFGLIIGVELADG